MKKTLLLGAAVIIVLAAIYYSSDNKAVVAPNVKNLTYVVDDKSITLVDGKSDTLSMFSEPVYGDLNVDGVDDAAILLTYNPGGSGTFFYAVLAMKKNGTYVPTNVMFLGDRIAPQTVEIHEGKVVYNFAERKGTDPMTASPSIGKSVWVHYDAKTNNIGEWVKGFEGEAN